MARIRTVKPELFRHEELFELECESGLPIRVAFVGLFTCCDREGRFKWKPKQLKLDCLPYDDLDFSRVLDALATAGFIVRYTVDSVTYGCIPTFTSHQVINNRERDSEIPEPAPENIDNTGDSTRQPRVNHASTTPLGNAQAEGNKEGKGTGNKEGKGTPRGEHAADAQELFEYWVFRMGKTAQAKFTAKRKQCTVARLKEGYDVQMLKRAIDGCAGSEYHMGKNDSGTVYDDLTLIFRSGDKVEQFATNVGKLPPRRQGHEPKTLDDFKREGQEQTKRILESGMLDDLD